MNRIRANLVTTTGRSIPGAERAAYPECMIAFAGLRPEGTIQDAKA